MPGMLKLPVDLARDLAGFAAGYIPLDMAPVTEIIENRHTGEERRWTSIHELVVKAHGSLWRTHYERGLTESQDISPFEDEGPEITLVQVAQKPVISFVYEPV